ncbi:hypothetical protein [Candidatus Clostridium radicumherbarum]|uniref:Uncharacterized protein n=1 Tax=Candidatus Clostridium radicumherbarum TaxID=3381662 RepID=A0ABW8TY58_9CLOT
MKNKYKITSALLFYFSIMMTVFSVIYSLTDYQHYLQHPEYSAPFSVNLIFKSVTYGIPIIIGFVLSFIFKSKAIKEKKL